MSGPRAIVAARRFSAIAALASLGAVGAVRPSTERAPRRAPAARRRRYCLRMRRARSGYLGYRVGITPAGDWQFFIAGD